MSAKIKGRGWRIFISRLGWPAAFIILIIIAKKVWPFSDAVRSYLEAALVFFAVFFVIRLLDAALLVRYTLRRKPYPLPDVLRGLILAALYLVLLFVILKTKLQVDIKPFLAGSSFLRRQTGDKAGELIVGEDEIAVLAEHVRRSIYSKGEVLCRQGDRGASCFVVAKGRIRGEIVYEESGKKYVSEFAVGPGGIFGEMSLFTGMPRTATGIVIEESELIEIRAEDFAVLLGRNPALAEVIAEIVSRRNEENREFLKKIKELSEKDIQDGTNKKTILAYLKRFVHGLIK